MRSDKTEKTILWQQFIAENGRIIYITMFIAIATDKDLLSYSPIIGWRRGVWGPFGGSAIMQFNFAVNELITRLPLIIKYRAIRLGI